MKNKNSRNSKKNSRKKFSQPSVNITKQTWKDKFYKEPLKYLNQNLKIRTKTKRNRKQMNAKRWKLI